MIIENKSLGSSPIALPTKVVRADLKVSSDCKLRNRQARISGATDETRKSKFLEDSEASRNINKLNKILNDSRTLK